MKWLFLLLLAANIALFIWGWEKEQQTTRQIVVLEPELGELRLLSEAPADAEAMPADTMAAEDDARQASPLPSSVDDSATGLESGGVPSTSHEGTEQAAKSISEAAVSNNVGDKSTVLAPAAVQPPALESEPTQEQEQEQEQEQITIAIPEESQAVAETAPTTPKLDRACGVIGPIEEEDKLRGIVTDLVERQIDAAQRTESVLRTVGFWVIIEPYGSQKQAIDAVNTLKQQGITDLRRFYKGELKNGISLGMYRRERNAETRRRQIVDKGFAAEMLARRKRTLLYFIDYQGPVPIVESMRENLIAEYPGIAVKPESCPRIATPGGIF